MRKLLTPEQVIELLQLDADGCPRRVARERLRHRLRTRQIPFVRLGRTIRFRSEDIKKLINDNLVPAVRTR